MNYSKLKKRLKIKKDGKPKRKKKDMKRKLRVTVKWVQRVMAKKQDSLMHELLLRLVITQFKT